MKKWKLFAATVLSAATLLTSIWTVPVYAEEGDVTEKPYISGNFSNEIGRKKIAQEDADVINEAFGYGWGSNTVIICGKDTSLWIDIENSLYGKDICKTVVFSPVFTRDENGKLEIETTERDIFGTEGVASDYRGYIHWYWDTEINEYHTLGWLGFGFESSSKGESWSEGYDEEGNENVVLNNYFSLNPNTSNAYAINTYLGDTSLLEPELADDVYIIRVYYFMEGNFDSEEFYYGWSDRWILPEGASTILNLEDIEEEPEASEEQYVVDLTTSTEPISKEDFATLLEENKTKDVVISSNNGVTFTFKAGTMTEVEGKEVYDFSTSIQNTYADTMPSYVTANNFVSQINFNYSGKLPADAYIRFSVGTQYAGQTLYYSLMNEAGTFAEVQAVTVDAEGYITVKQNHCSSYVVTTENPETPNTTPETPTTETTQDTTKKSPKTGEPEFTIVCVLALASIGGATVVMFDKKRNMR